MPLNNSGGSTKFPGGHKVIHRTAQTAFVRVVTLRTKVYERYWNVRYDINIVSFSSIDTYSSGKSGLVSVHLSKLRLPFIL